MSDNQIIHEAMGLCWHENVVAETPGWFYCIDCGVFVGDTLPIPSSDYPDYTDPVYYCALMDWMREDRNRVIQINRVFSADNFFRLTRQQQVSLIAEAIREGVLK